MAISAGSADLLWAALLPSFSGPAAAADPTPATGDLATSSDPQTSAVPRSLLVCSAGSLLLLGLPALTVAREQRRRALRELNG